ncbi:hypothetical protein CC80DRAFT_550037 [Byssothecium circinans]|uniref:Uncharacterized protein n=1 Tax=Byssothecium circinans TaxID=147558 RepID=A0A6A5TPN0_9PLEO|nr:hypothetical protein CC80DRAFT_550037 [Byssothecium circinans]
MDPFSKHKESHLPKGVQTSATRILITIASCLGLALLVGIIWYILRKYPLPEYLFQNDDEVWVQEEVRRRDAARSVARSVDTLPLYETVAKSGVGIVESGDVPPAYEGARRGYTV